MGMAILWPLRNLQGKSTGRWYENLVTPKPAAVDDDAFRASLAPVAFVLAWPWLLVLASGLGLLHLGDYSGRRHHWAAVATAVDAAQDAVAEH